MLTMYFFENNFCIFFEQTVLSVKTYNLYVCVHISSKSFKEAVVKQKLFLAFYKEQLIHGWRRPLKGPSGQIRSAWEWYHWRGLGKTSTAIIFSFLILNLSFSKEFLAASYHILRPFFLFSWRTFFWWKNMPKWRATRYPHQTALETLNVSLHFWGTRLAEK